MIPCWFFLVVALAAIYSGAYFSAICFFLCLLIYASVRRWAS